MISPLFLSRIQSLFQIESNEALKLFSHKRKGSFRINIIKNQEAFVIEEMKNRGIEISIFENIPHAYTFNTDDLYNLRGSDSFYSGYIYLQSLSSMLPIFAFEKGTHSILDACAAPGGKTTGIAAYLGRNSQITALEKNQIRYNRLTHNIELQGAHGIQAIKIDALKFFETHTEKFDAILLDVPCSGEGTFDVNNPKSYSHWSLDFITKKSQLQSKLLEGASTKIKDGGYIIYSTCTLAPEENEAVITNFLNKNPDFSLEKIDALEKIVGEYMQPGISHFEGNDFHSDIQKTIRIVPGEKFEGFFIAKLRKEV